MKKASRTKISWHKTNFEDDITKYAQTGPHPLPAPLLWVGEKGNMSGDEWERALAAAKRLDYTSERDAQPNMQLIPSQPSFVRRVVRRLVSRSPQGEHLSELDDIQAFLKRAPKSPPR